MRVRVAGSKNCPPPFSRIGVAGYLHECPGGDDERLVQAGGRQQKDGEGSDGITPEHYERTVAHDTANTINI